MASAITRSAICSPRLPRRSAPWIVFGILFEIGVGIGLVLLIIPGLILLTMWSVGAPAIVVERAGAFQAFGRSWHLVRGEAWSVFWTLWWSC